MNTPAVHECKYVLMEVRLTVAGEEELGDGGCCLTTVCSCVTLPAACVATAAA